MDNLGDYQQDYNTNQHQPHEELKNLRDEVYSDIKYCDDVSLVETGQQIPDEKGELFFEPFEGYCLSE